MLLLLYVLKYVWLIFLARDRFMETSARDVVNVEETFARKHPLALVYSFQIYNHGISHPAVHFISQTPLYYLCLPTTNAVLVRRVVAAREAARNGTAVFNSRRRQQSSNEIDEIEKEDAVQASHAGNPTPESTEFKEGKWECCVIC
jgi:hypothetical protein